MVFACATPARDRITVRTGGPIRRLLHPEVRGSRCGWSHAEQPRETRHFQVFLRCVLDRSYHSGLVCIEWSPGTSRRPPWPCWRTKTRNCLPEYSAGFPAAVGTVALAAVPAPAIVAPLFVRYPRSAIAGSGPSKAGLQRNA